VFSQPENAQKLKGPTSKVRRRGEGEEERGKEGREMPPLPSKILKTPLLLL